MQLKNLETNNVFNVPEEMAKEFVSKDRKLFKIIDEGYKPEETKVIETKMFDSVVVSDKDDILEDIDTMSRQELRDYCKLKGIKFSVTYSADKLRELIKG